MPTHFGPSYGPRQGPDGRKFENINAPKTTSMSVRFLSNSEQLKEFLPEGFTIRGQPLVTVTASYIKEIEWLAGRGYNTLGVNFPVTFIGDRDKVSGNFLTVLWENLTDPILTGREELGYSKIYCELPEPRVYGGKTQCMASWMGFKFMDMVLWNLNRLSPEENEKYFVDSKSEGVLHYKYIPKTGSWGEAEVEYTTFNPSKGNNKKIKETWKGEGSVKFHKATWEDLPTQYNIVNKFCELEVKKFVDATIVKSVGGKDLGDQRIVK
jgi:hypothetical protein